MTQTNEPPGNAGRFNWGWRSVDTLERRVARLEQDRNSSDHIEPLLITSVGAENHFGDFAVEYAGGGMILNRPPGESWADFEARMNQLAFEQQRSPLCVICFFPKTIEGEAGY